MAIDPVCGMEIADDTKLNYTHGNHTYLFCSAHCLAQFKADPKKFLSKAEPTAVAQKQQRIYTCPMHPEILQNTPGSCLSFRTQRMTGQP